MSLPYEIHALLLTYYKLNVSSWNFDVKFELMGI